MTTTTGTSTAAPQTLLTNATLNAALFNIEMYDTPLPPFRRVGYYYLYFFLTTSPNQCYLQDSGLVYAPGILRRVPVPITAANTAQRLDVVWNVSGLRWRATLGS